jgi:MoaA/NifB/PqqE/SkfB family radical SAM enzyme
MGVTQIAFHLTDRCQLDCKHCLRDPAQKPLDLPLEILQSVLDQVKRLHGTMHVSLTGGEPTLHPAFLDVVDAIGERAMTWHMISNGRSFPWLLKSLAGRPNARRAMKHVYFSLDGADEPTHDKIRGPGSFREVMSACALASVHEIPFALQLVVNALNHHQLEAVGMLAAQLGAMRVSFCMLQPTGTKHDDVLKLPIGQWHAIADRIDRLTQILRIEVRAPEGWPTKQPFHVCEIFQSVQLHVDVEGRMNLCCQHAGIPASSDAPASGESDVVADLRTTSVAEAQRRLLGVIHRAQAAKLAQIDAEKFGPWDHFGCNWCLKYFGKPHWEEAGATGPAAERERWIGAWGEPKNQSPRVRLPLAP